MQNEQEILIKLIVTSGKSIAEIARGAGLAQPVVSRFVNGTRGITCPTADKLRHYFGLKIVPS